MACKLAYFTYNYQIIMKIKRGSNNQSDYAANLDNFLMTIEAMTNIFQENCVYDDFDSEKHFPNNFRDSKISKEMFAFAILTIK